MAARSNPSQRSTFAGSGCSWARVTGVDLTQPLDARRSRRCEAHAEHGVLVFPDQVFSSRKSSCASAALRRAHGAPVLDQRRRRPELIVYDNKEGNPPRATDIWHTDETFREAPPMGTMLCSKIVPEVGGDTAFASMTAVYEGLSDRWQRLLSGLEAVHDFMPFQGLFHDAAGRSRTPRARGPVPAGGPPGGERAPGHGQEGALRQPAVHALHQGHGGGREPDAARALYRRRSCTSTSTATTGSRTWWCSGTTARAALGAARLLSAAPPDGAGDDRRHQAAAADAARGSGTCGATSCRRIAVEAGRSATRSISRYASREEEEGSSRCWMMKPSWPSGPRSSVGRARPVFLQGQFRSHRVGPRGLGAQVVRMRQVEEGNEHADHHGQPANHVEPFHTVTIQSSPTSITPYDFTLLSLSKQQSIIYIKPEQARTSSAPVARNTTRHQGVGAI